jgi:hypothetical protein
MMIAIAFLAVPSTTTSQAAVPSFAIVTSGTLPGAVDAANVIGHERCGKCHASEVGAWSGSSHAKKSYNLLSHEKAPAFAKALGVTGNLAQSVCGDCHATKQADTVIQGVSCESCHGASGPERSIKGWFSIHSYYGKDLKDRKKETEDHYKKRIAASHATGMNSSSHLYELAKNCLSCHTVPNEKLVNAGHPTSSRFELVEWAQGEVRHNFQIDQTVNAKSPSLWLDPHWNGKGRTSANRKKLMYVVGQLVDLEVSLRSRATATEGDFATVVGRRISSVLRKLKKLDHIPAVAKALAAVEKIDRTALKTFGAGDKKLYGDAADAVGAAARAISGSSDGSDLGEVDVPDDAVGEAFLDG